MCGLVQALHVIKSGASNKHSIVLHVEVTECCLDAVCSTTGISVRRTSKTCAMVVVFQQSCFEIPLNASDWPRVRYPTKKVPKKRLVEQRKRLWQDVVDETRVWSLAAALPLDCYAPSPQSRFHEEMHDIAKLIFGPQVEERKIRAVFGRIGLDLLASSEEAVDNRPELSLEEIQLISSDWHVPHAVKRKLFEASLNEEDYWFFETSGLTWGGLYKYAEDYQVIVSSIMCKQSTRRSSKKAARSRLTGVLPELQNQWVRRELGLSMSDTFTYEARERFERWTRHRKGDAWHCLTDIKALNLGTRDVCAVRAFPKQPFDGSRSFRMADMYQEGNLMTLYPDVLCRAKHGSITDFMTGPNLHDRRKWRGNLPETIIHELTHSGSLLHNTDADMNVRSDRLGRSNSPRHLLELEGRRDSGQFQWLYEKAYGDELAFTLGARDAVNGSNSAEDSADQWAIFSRIRLLTLMYPELDFMSNRTFQQRHFHLLHHCTLFDCLRPPSIGSTRDLGCYNPDKDPWREWQVKDTEELLLILAHLAAKNRAKELSEHLERARCPKRPARHNNLSDLDKEESYSDHAPEYEYLWPKDMNLRELHREICGRELFSDEVAPISSILPGNKEKKKISTTEARVFMPKKKARKCSNRAQKRDLALREQWFNMDEDYDKELNRDLPLA